MPPLLCFSTLACPDWSWQQIVELGQAAGFQGVEIRLIEREVNLLSLPLFSEGQIDQRLSELSRHDFRVAGLASSVRFDDSDPAALAAHMESGRGYIDLAKKLGAAFVRVFGDVLPADAAERERIIEQIASGLSELGDYGSERGISVLIETHGDFSDTLLLENLLLRVKSPGVGVVWDTHHPWRFFGEPLDETCLRLKPWTRHTHWKDSRIAVEREQTPEMLEAEQRASELMRGHRPADYVLFGAGEFPAAECLRVLLASGYEGWHSLEWEKAWHPELEGPEVALPPFPAEFQKLWRAAGRN